MTIDLRSKRRVFKVVGISLIVAAGLRTGQIEALLSQAVRVPGVVETGGPGGRHPVIRYRGRGGQSYSLMAGGVFKPLQTGEHVDVIYNPSDPAGTARLDTTASLWSAVVLLMGLGSALILVPPLNGVPSASDKPEADRPA